MKIADLIAAVQKAYGESYTQKQAADAVAAVLAAIAEGIKKDKAGVEIPGFGSFKVTTRKPRKGRNPRTGSTAIEKPKKSVRFSASSVFFDNTDGTGSTGPKSKP